MSYCSKSSVVPCRIRPFPTMLSKWTILKLKFDPGMSMKFNDLDEKRKTRTRPVIDYLSGVINCILHVTKWGRLNGSPDK